MIRIPYQIFSNQYDFPARFAMNEFFPIHLGVGLCCETTDRTNECIMASRKQCDDRKRKLVDARTRTRI